MLIVMKPQATQAQIALVVEKIHALGLDAHEIPGAQRVAIGITGNRSALDPSPSLRCQGWPTPSGSRSLSSWCRAR